jgi:hypothetical protein
MRKAEIHRLTFANTLSLIFTGAKREGGDILSAHERVSILSDDPLAAAA